MPELRIAVRVSAALDGLGVGLEAVAEVVEQARDEGWAGFFVSQGAKLGGELAQALARPPQGALGISTCHRVDEAVQVIVERVVLEDSPDPSTSTTTRSALGNRLRCAVQLGDAGAHRVR